MLGVISYVYMYPHKMNEKYQNSYSGNRCLTGLWMIFKFISPESFFCILYI